ncbi:MAG: hypothetical protein O7B81_09835 [Gammaproteobacteria bacterium]|nr:hypothetical protein [Gammaproteobacteria bacterium]
MFQNVIITRPARGVASTRTALPKREYRLTAWHHQFVEKMRSLNTTKQLRIQRFVDQTFMPVFEEIKALTEDLGLSSSSSMSRSGTLMFRFVLEKQATLLMTIRPRELGCDVLNQFSIPSFRIISPTYDSTETLDEQQDWARKVFEEALDIFADALAEAADEQSFGAHSSNWTCHIGAA